MSSELVSALVCQEEASSIPNRIMRIPKKRQDLKRRQRQKSRRSKKHLRSLGRLDAPSKRISSSQGEPLPARATAPPSTPHVNGQQASSNSRSRRSSCNPTLHLGRDLPRSHLCLRLSGCRCYPPIVALNKLHLQSPISPLAKMSTHARPLPNSSMMDKGPPAEILHVLLQDPRVERLRRYQAGPAWFDIAITVLVPELETGWTFTCARRAWRI